MKLVEIIRGKETDDETVARAFDYVQAIGKIADRGQRLARLLHQPRVRHLRDGRRGHAGRRHPGAGDRERRRCQAGMPVGPLAVLDETSLSLSRARAGADPRRPRGRGQDLRADTRAKLLVERMVKELKRPGRAGGGGFYDYPAGRQEAPLAASSSICSRSPARPGTSQELKDRLLYRQAIETARCLDEGVLTSVHDANIGSIFGIGFPAWTGGAMQFIYGRASTPSRSAARNSRARHGDGFALSPTVKEAIRKHEPRW